jgi:hypothetical protein
MLTSVVQDPVNTAATAPAPASRSTVARVRRLRATLAATARNSATAGRRVHTDVARSSRPTAVKARNMRMTAKKNLGTDSGSTAAKLVAMVDSKPVSMALTLIALVNMVVVAKRSHLDMAVVRKDPSLDMVANKSTLVNLLTTLAGTGGEWRVDMDSLSRAMDARSLLPVTVLTPTALADMVAAKSAPSTVESDLIRRMVRRVCLVASGKRMRDAVVVVAMMRMSMVVRGDSRMAVVAMVDMERRGMEGGTRRL